MIGVTSKESYSLRTPCGCRGSLWTQAGLAFGLSVDDPGVWIVVVAIEDPVVTISISPKDEGDSVDEDFLR